MPSRCLDLCADPLHAQTSAASSTQRINYVAADVSTFEGARKAIDACEVVPDTVLCCAGGAKPGFFLEQTEADFEAGMKTDYWTCLATAHVSVCATRLARPLTLRPTGCG